jgi:hypothetical protein
LLDHGAYAIALSSLLSDLGAVRLTSGAWLLTSDWNACAILEQLRPVVGENDRVLVFELGDDLAGLNILDATPFTDADRTLQPPQSPKVN